MDLVKHKNVGHSLLTLSVLCARRRLRAGYFREQLLISTQSQQVSIVAHTNALSFLYEHVIGALDSLFPYLVYLSCVFSSEGL